MTVFRLLTKNGGWVWVQANARLVYKGGRPDFIIARQRALVYVLINSNPKAAYRGTYVVGLKVEING